MEQLEELCARTESPRCRRPSAKLSSFQEQQESKKDVALLSSASQSSLRVDTARLRLSEPVTMYSDLRGAKLQKSVPFPDEKQSPSDSSSEEEETMTTLDETERRMRNCSAKSFLLQQLRTAHKEASGLLHKPSTLAETPEGTKQDSESLEEIDSSKIRQTQHFKVRQETNKMIPRKLMGLKAEEKNTSLSSLGGSEAAIEKENSTEIEK
ncbi:hypothetical protein N303_04382, partial [Cuculus canorus]